MARKHKPEEIIGKLREAEIVLAQALQHRQATQLVGVSAPGPGSGDAAMAALRFRFAPPTVTHGARGNYALTNNTDHSVGAGHLNASLAAATARATSSSPPPATVAQTVSVRGFTTSNIDGFNGSTHSPPIYSLLCIFI